MKAKVLIGSKMSFWVGKLTALSFRFSFSCKNLVFDEMKWMDHINFIFKGKIFSFLLVAVVFDTYILVW